MNEILRVLRLEKLHLALLLVIALLALAGHLTNENFISLANFSNIQEQMVALSLVALAQSIVILSGGIDLSYAGFISLLSVMFASLAGETAGSLILALLLVFACGIVIGACQGAFVAYVKIHPLIVTIAGSTMLSGLALLITKQPTGSVPIFFEDLAYETFLAIPISSYLIIFLYLTIAYVLYNSKFGIRIYALGKDPNACLISGVPVKKTIVCIYAFSGFLIACASVYLVARTAIGDPRSGIGFDLRSITPVIIGGIVLSGGFGGVVGTLLAVILLSLLANMLNFMNISAYYQWIIEGLIIIIALSFCSKKAGRA